MLITLIENPENERQIVLPSEHIDIVDCLDGEHTVKDVVEHLYAVGGSVSFNSVIKTIRLLDTIDLLHENFNELFKVDNDKTPHQHQPIFLIRPLFKRKLFGKFEKPKVSQKGILFSLFSGLIVLFLGYELFTWDYQFDFSFFQTANKSKVQTLVLLLIFSSVLISMKSVIKTLLLFFASGKIFGAHLQITPFSISYSVNENSIYASSSKKVIISYGILNSVLYLVSFFILKDINFFSGYTNDLFIMSLMLTLIELDPYRHSDLTKIFSYLYADDQLKSIKPYLENCTLSSLIDKGEGKKDELRYILYSSLAISWSVIFALFSLELLVSNLANLLDAVLVSDDENIRFNSLFKMSFLGVIFGYLAIDLFKTIAQNIWRPLTNISGTKFKKKGKTVEDARFSRDKISPMIKSNMLFNNLSPEAIEFLLFHMNLKKLPMHGDLITQGARDRSVYFILDGELEVLKKDEFGKENHIVDLFEQTIVGEMAIINDNPRSATVRAKTEVYYVEFSEEVFKKFIDKPELKNDFDQLKNKVEISHFVSSAGIFKDFPTEIMNLFVEAGDLVIFPENAKIVEQGELDKTFYLLIKGSVDVIKDDVNIATLKQGDFFGEISLVSNVPRTATVQTNEETLLLFIESSKFWNILSSNIELAMYIESVGRHRLSEVQEYDEAS
jgi:CRP-like cAMP-binding protein